VLRVVFFSFFPILFYFSFLFCCQSSLLFHRRQGSCWLFFHILGNRPVRDNPTYTGLEKTQCNIYPPAHPRQQPELQGFFNQSLHFPLHLNNADMLAIMCQCGGTDVDDKPVPPKVVKQSQLYYHQRKIGSISRTITKTILQSIKDQRKDFRNGRLST